MASFNEFREMVQQLDAAYRHWTGVRLPAPDSLSEDQRLAWLHSHAPYALLAHGTEADPLFYYANEQALASFKYPRDQFIGMPSRFSASPLDREMRQTLLEQVTAKGIAHGYSGYRVDCAGQAFMIHQAVSGRCWTKRALVVARRRCSGQTRSAWGNSTRFVCRSGKKNRRFRVPKAAIFIGRGRQVKP